MSFRVFDLTDIYRRFELSDDIGTVTINGIPIAICHGEASYGPRVMTDDEYWEDPVHYIYSIAAQTDFGFPLMSPEKPVPSCDILAIQLAQIRHMTLPVEGFIEAYTRIYVLAHAAFYPRNRLREIVGVSDFEYFVPDYTAKKVTFVIDRDDTYTIDITDEVDLGAWYMVEDTVGRTNAYNEPNAEMISWLIEPPEDTKDVDDDDAFYRNVRGHMLAKLRLKGYMSD